MNAEMGMVRLAESGAPGVFQVETEFTVLHLPGLRHEKLTYRYSGRDFRLADVAGVVAKKILA